VAGGDSRAAKPELAVHASAAGDKARLRGAPADGGVTAKPDPPASKPGEQAIRPEGAGSRAANPDLAVRAPEGGMVSPTCPPADGFGGVAMEGGTPALPLIIGCLAACTSTCLVAIGASAAPAPSGSLMS